MRKLTRPTVPSTSALQGSSTIHWHDFLWSYSVPTLAASIAIGLVAFLISGYLGYPSEPSLLDRPFHPATALFLWFCGMLYLLLLRNPAVQGRQRVLVVAFLLSMSVVGLYYIDRSYNNGNVVAVVIKWLQGIGLQPGAGRLLANLINFFILGGYTLGMLIRWWRRYGPGNSAKRSTVRSPDESFGGRPPWRDLRNEIDGELFSGDLIAGAALASMLTLIFSQSVFTELVRLLAPIAATSSSCTASLPVGNCPAEPHEHVTYVFLSDIDVRVAVLFAAVGGVFLAVVSAIKAFRAGSPDRIVFEFARTLFSALGRLLTLRFFTLIKDVIWPLCILGSAAGAALAAQFVQCDLHLVGAGQLLSDCHLASVAPPNVPLSVGAFLILGLVILVITFAPRRMRGASLEALRGLIGPLFVVLVLIEILAFAPTRVLGIIQDDQYVLYALAWLLISTLFLIFGIGLYLARPDLIGESLTFVAFVGVIAIDVFWVFSFALIGMDHFFIPAPWPHPFQPNDAAWFSLVCFLLTVVVVILLYQLRIRLPNLGWQEGASSKPSEFAPKESEAADVASGDAASGETEGARETLTPSYDDGVGHMPPSTSY